MLGGWPSTIYGRICPDLGRQDDAARLWRKTEGPRVSAEIEGHECESRHRAKPDDVAICSDSTDSETKERADANEGLQRADPSACDAGAINDRAKVSDDRKRRRKPDNSLANRAAATKRSESGCWSRDWVDLRHSKENDQRRKRANKCRNPPRSTKG